MTVLMYIIFQSTGKFKNISGRQSFASCISDIFLKFSVYELWKFRHISNSNTRCCVLRVATITLF